MNTVIFSIYDGGYRSSALLLNDGADWGMLDVSMYKEQILDDDETQSITPTRNYSPSLNGCLTRKLGGLLLRLMGTFIRCVINAREDFSGMKRSTGKFRKLTKNT